MSLVIFMSFSLLVSILVLLWNQMQRCFGQQSSYATDRYFTPNFDDIFLIRQVWLRSKNVLIGWNWVKHFDLTFELQNMSLWRTPKYYACCVFRPNFFFSHFQPFLWKFQQLVNLLTIRLILITFGSAYSLNFRSINGNYSWRRKSR